MTDHMNRLTLVNRKLVADLNAAHSLLRRMLDPDDLGHAVSQEVRDKASALIGDNSNECPLLKDPRK